MTSVWEYSHLRDQSQLLVMLALADFSNEEGECFPSVSTLAEKSRVSERHVQKVISHLQQHGLVTVEKGAGRGRIPGQRSNLYRINLNQLRSNASIPAPNYKEQNDKKRQDKADRIHPRHNDTPTPGTMTPVGVAYAQKRGVIMPPEPSVLEPSKETTTTTRNLSKSNGAVKTSVVVVASSSPDNVDEPTENLSSNPDGPSKRINRYRKNPKPAVGNIRDQDTLDAIMEADSPSESGKTTFGKAEYSIHKNVKAERRVHKNVKAQFTRELNLSSKECEAEISNRETEKRNDDDQSKLHEQLPTKQPVAVVASSWPDDDDEPAEIVEKLTEKLKLSYDQSKTVQFYIDQDGKGYVLEKAALTRSKDLRNAGGFFIRALEKDYREPVTNTKPPLPPKKKRVEPKPEEQPTTDEERAQTSAKLKEFIQRLRASC